MNNNIKRTEFSKEFVKGLIDLIWNKGFSPYYSIFSSSLLLSLYKEGILTEETINLSTRIEVIRKNICLTDSKYLKIFLKILDIFESNLTILNESDFHSFLKYLRSVDLHFLNKNFSEIFEILLFHIVHSQGKYNGEFVQPLEITRLMCNLAEIKTGAKVYNPFAGFASFEMEFNKEHNYYGQEYNRETWALAALRLLAHNKDVSDIKLEDSILNWPGNNNKFDLVISNPPFKSKINIYNELQNRGYKTLDSFLFGEGSELLNDTGKMIILLPESVLFANIRSEVAIREKLINADLIDTVISLPTGILLNTGVKTSIVVLNKAKKYNGKIRFVNAESFIIKNSSKDKILDDASIFNLLINPDSENEMLVFTGNETIKQNNFDLSVNRYFIEQPENGVSLRELLTAIKGNRISNIENLNLIKISDLKDDVIDFELDANSIGLYENRNNRGFQKIEEDCLLLTTRFKNLKPTFFKFLGEPLYIDEHNILAFKINDKKVDIKYLIKELHSDYVIKQLKAYSKGTAISFLSRNDLLNIKIVLPTLEEQNLIYLNAVNKNFNNERKLLFEKYEEQITDINDENSFLRHQIAGSIKDIKSSLKMLNKILESKVEPVISNVFELKFSEDMSNNLGGYLNSMNNHLISIEKSMKTVKKQIELSDLTIEEFDLLKFIKDYYAHLQIREDKNYSVELELDELTLQDANLKKVIVNADKTRLKQAFDNLVENAVKHAFEINQPNKLLIQLLFDLEDSRVQIDFSNTGNPLPENVSHESLVRKGSTIGENGGDGIGLWFVNDMMKLFGGKFGFTDETGSEGIDGEYVTSMELTLPIITTYEKI